MAVQSKYALLIRLADDKTEAAAKAMAAAQKLLEQARLKCTQLDGYIGEYRRQRVVRAAGGLSAAQWIDYQQFLERLNDALALQKDEVSQREIEVERLRARWLAERQRLKAFETLHQQEQARALQKQAKIEQKLSDELAGRAFGRDRS